MSHPEAELVSCVDFPKSVILCLWLALEILGQMVPHASEFGKHCTFHSGRPFTPWYCFSDSEKVL